MKRGTAVFSSLKLQFTVILVAVALIGAGIAAIGFHGVLQRIAQHLGGGYAGRYALSNRALLQEPLTREIAHVLHMADSPLVHAWANNETDPDARLPALAELENFRRHVAEGSWFLVVHDSLNYYYDDGSGRFGETARAYTLDRSLPDDAWYFATVDKVPTYALNVNYDRELDVRKVWINAVIREPDGSPIAMIGTGLDLSGFLEMFIDHADPGVDNLILDTNLAIQAHGDRRLIDFQSITQTDTHPRTFENKLNPHDFNRVREALERLRRADSQTEAIPVRLNGKRKTIGVAYLSNLDWFVLSILDMGAVMYRPYFRPVLGVAVLLSLFVVALTGWLIHHRLVLPLAMITRAARRLPGNGDHGSELPLARSDEIGLLARTFESMRRQVHDHSAHLEACVAQRTAELAASNRELSTNVVRLEEALARVRTLKTLLPICCACHKIRDDEGYWSELDKYIRQHTDTEFTHGICPDCMRNLYPEPGPVRSEGQAD